jgi:hypothetical protein
MRGNGAESPTVGLSPSMTATAAPPRTKPRTDIASSRLPRAAPWMKPEIPKVLLLKERRACTGKAAQTPPRKDWRGVEPGRDMVRWVYAVGGQCHFRGVGRAQIRVFFSSRSGVGLGIRGSSLSSISQDVKSTSGTHICELGSVLSPPQVYTTRKCHRSCRSQERLS